MLWFRSFLSILIVCIFLTPGYAQEETQNTPPPYDPTFPIKLDLDNSLLASLKLGRDTSPYLPPKIIEEEPSEPLEVPSYLNLRLQYDRPYFPDYWTTYANQPHKIVITRYKGLYGFAYKQISRVVDKYYKDLLKDYWWQRAKINPFNVNLEIRDYNLRSSDYGHRWWEQREFFYDYFPEERGGARIIYHTIGENREIFSIGPLQLSNTGKVRWSDWGLTFSSDDDDEFKNDALRNKLEHQIQDSQNTKRPIQTNPLAERSRRLSFGIKLPRGNLYTGNYFTISGSINFGLRLDTLNKNGTSIKGQIRITGLWGINNTPWYFISIKVTAKPFREEYSTSFSVSLFRW